MRGIEIILRDRDPRDAWAFAQRICGVCTLVHGLASVRAVEDALDVKVPPNAELIRDLMAAPSCCRIMSSISTICRRSTGSIRSTRSQANPQAAAATAEKFGYRETSVDYFAAAQDRLKDFVKPGNSAFSPMAGGIIRTTS